MTGGRRKRGFRCALALYLALLLLAGAWPAGAQQEPVKIGALFALSGDVGLLGEPLRQAVTLAVSHVNEQGGILGGRTLGLVIADDRTDPATGVAEARRLVEVEGIAALVGPDTSGVALAVAAEVSVPNRVVTVTLATSPRVASLDDDDYVFRTAVSDALQGRVLAGLAARLGFTRLATLHVDNPYGQDLAATFASSFAASGGTVTESLPFEPGQASYRPLLERAAAGGAQALLLIAYPESGLTILNEAIAGGYFRRFFFSDGMQDPSVIEAVGAPLEGAWGTGPSSAETRGSRVIRQMYEQLYGPLESAAYFYEAYDAAFLVALAIEKAGEVSGPAIRAAMRELSAANGVPVLPGEWAKAVELIRAGVPIRYEGAAFTSGFDPAGDLSQGLIGIWTVFDGKLRTVATERIGE